MPPCLQKPTADLFRKWNCHYRKAPPFPSQTCFCPFTDSALECIFNLPWSPFALCSKTFELAFFLANICFWFARMREAPLACSGAALLMPSVRWPLLPAVDFVAEICLIFTFLHAFMKQSVTASKPYDWIKAFWCMCFIIMINNGAFCDTSIKCTFLGCQLPPTPLVFFVFVFRNHFPET